MSFFHNYSKYHFLATVNDFEKVFAVNVRGTYLCFKYAAEQMMRQGSGGRLIAASSMAGMSGQAMGSLYSSTKYAIRGLVTSTGKPNVFPPRDFFKLV